MIRLPAPTALEARCLALAALDAVICEEWEYRAFSFDPEWGPGQRMGSMRDGEGSEWFVVFEGERAFLVGTEDEVDAIVGLLDGVPAAFAEHAAEPAFSPDDATFAAWYDGAWHAVGDGSPLLVQLAGGPADYVAYAAMIHELDLDVRAVAHVLALRPLTGDVLDALGCDRDRDELAAELAGMGYPS